MAKIIDWFLGVSDDDYDDEEELTENEDGGRKSRRRVKAEQAAAAKEAEASGISAGSPFGSSAAGKKPASVVSVYSQKQYKVIVVKPCVFNDAQTIAEHLKARSSIIINLEKTEEDLAQRFVDFISGATFALGGSMQKLGEGIFMFVPSNVDINDEQLIAPYPGQRDVSWLLNR
ncbi:MAG: cell division protein SepF [Gracilibacteraceae bacterium]|jgi:cell division inhibitor SepF|nr:cell division protein SepF [Gracilibacteraceae bacterium]